MPLSRELRSLVAGLEEAFQKRSWHGTNLLGSIRGLDPERAAWRPTKGGRGSRRGGAGRRHNIWEVVVHTAYWKYAVTRRLVNAPRGSFPLAGSNWFPRNRGSAADWRRDVHLLKACHTDLLEAVRRTAATRLHKPPGGRGEWTVEEMVRGVAVHDLYHAGQIQLLKRLRGDK